METEDLALEHDLNQIIRTAVDRIVAVAHPTLIVLFGSAARGQLGPNSDLDFLVVVEEPVHRRRLAQAIYRNLVGVGFPIDIVVATAEDVAQYRDNPAMVISPALREGKTVYAA
ncbi:MAG TPA: nucleotidyltransferase domain-containing protein [Chloroflexota bacterium]|nr:nucleotidyltransferase domain-containing protein [Chloroflexota bacterium]